MKPVPLLSQADICTFFAILAAHIDPKSELNWNSPLDLLVAVVLSAQCTDRLVNRVTPPLFARCRTPDDYLKLGENDLRELIRSIGLFRNKARAIIGLCARLKAEHNGQVPGDYDALLALPGVGRKTANVVLNVVFKKPVIAVDTHVFRVANRTGLAPGKTPKEVEQALMKRVPEKYRLHAHHYLILHGRYTCTARRPKCTSCPVAHLCPGIE